MLPFLHALPGEIGRARAAVAEGAEPDLDRLVDGTNGALEALRELTRGVFPSQLVRSGLEPTLHSLFARSGPGVELIVDVAAGRRYAPRAEAAVYFCCAEALRVGGPASVNLTCSAEELVLRITGSHDCIDLQGVMDRVEAVGGHVTAEPGQLLLAIPVAETAAEPESALAGNPSSPVPGV